jgi:hypothetical protein
MNTFNTLPFEVQLVIAIATILAIAVVCFGLTALYHANKKEYARTRQVKLHLNKEISLKQAA